MQQQKYIPPLEEYGFFDFFDSCRITTGKLLLSSLVGYAAYFLTEDPAAFVIGTFTGYMYINQNALLMTSRRVEMLNREVDKIISGLESISPPSVKRKLRKEGLESSLK